MSLDHSQRKPEEYKKPHRVSVEEIIPDIKPDDGTEQKGNFNSLPTSYSEYTVNQIAGQPEVRKFYSDFKDQIVVDLGCGDNLNGYSIAAASGAKAYIGVEPYNYANLEQNFKKLEEGEVGVYTGLNQHIPFALVKKDMFGFLRRLPPRSVSILMNGIDGAIISRRVSNNQSYVHAVNLTFERVLHKDGAAIIGSDLGIIDLRSDFEKIPYIRKGIPFEPLGALVKFKLKKV